MAFTRREFSKLALSAIPAGLASDALLGAQGRPNSKVAGVQLGLNVPYSFGSDFLLKGDETLAGCVALGVSALELRSQPVEVFLGAPMLAGAAANAPAAIEALRAWREKASLDRVKEFRAKYENAGVAIEVVKFDRVFQLSDGELDFAFTLGKALGAKALSCEIARPVDGTKRVGQFADKHKMMIGYHGHAETAQADWEQAFGFAQYNGANVDIGHFIVGNKTSPIPLIEKHHARITHLHIKDRRSAANGGANVPFGEGDTPIKEVLQLLKKTGWPIQATIEFEYPVPAGSTRMAEIAKALDYCRKALA